MKIAYFVWEYPPRLIGGLGTYAAEITKKFDEMGHDVHVFTMNDNHSLLTNEKVGRTIEVHRPIVADASTVFPVFVDEELRRWGTGFKFFADVLSYNVLAANKYVNDVARTWQADVIVSHDWLGAMAGMIAKQNTKAPYVQHFHSTEYGRSGGGGSSTVRGLEYEAAQQADMLVTVSYAMREELNFLKYPAAKTRVLWNGVDEKKCDLYKYPKAKRDEYRDSIGVDAKEKMILFTGRLTWVKGIDSLLRAMPAILDKAPNTMLVVLGRGEMLDELKAVAAQLSVAKNVIFIDRWVDEKERLMIYASADLVCAPSRYEPFGIVSLEGMAMRKPVLVGYGGLREAVIEGQHGLYCDPNSPQNIAEQALKILLSDDLAKKFGDNGRKRVEEYFTWDKVAADTIALYETLIGK